jgi:glycosyltransferase involved in cell wall biosynthesis
VTAPFRLLIATDFYPPFIGGLEWQSALEARELAARGHAVTVATAWHPGLPERELDGGVEVRRLKGLFNRVPWLSSVAGRRYHPPLPDPAMVVQLRRLIRSVRPDVVNAAGWIGYSSAAAVAGLRVPLVLSVRDNGYGCAVRTLVRGDVPCDGPATGKCLRCAARHYGAAKGTAAVLGVRGGRRFLARRVDVFHCVSRYVRMTIERDVLGAGAGRPHPVALVPDIVVTGDGEPAGPPAGMPGEGSILFVGAIHPHKGVGTLLAAHARLRSPPPLVLIGTRWPQSPERFPPNVHVLTDVPHDQVMAAWAGCLFGVAPSITPEGFGDVVVEAMSAGKAVIGSTIGGHRDTIEDGVTGLLVPPGDAGALAAAMRRLIEDAPLRERLAAGGRARARRYRPEAVVPRLEALLDRARRRGVP